ncbi:MAG: 3-phosphoshikimate 1-carboxyvinyltransferase [Anaerolineales bacterium]
MILTVIPDAPLRGRVRLPGDKSLSHRSALLAGLAEGESRIANFLVSGVTQAMLGALSALGIAWELQGTQLQVTSAGIHKLQPPIRAIDCGNSATTLRLLAGGLAAAGVPAILTGSQGLRRRPMKRIVEPLQRMGVVIESSAGKAPLVLNQASGRLRALDHTLLVASAQVKTCLLLAALAAEGTTTLREPGPSRDHTERMLRSLGIDLVSQRIEASGTAQYITRLTPPDELHLPPIRMELPGDFSAAAFLIVAALVTPGSEIVLADVGLNPTRTGLLDVLQAMGGDILIVNSKEQYGEPLGDLVVRHSTLRGAQVDGSLVVRMIDEFPVFAVAAAYAQGLTVVRQADELRHKESDRISDLCVELGRLGAEVQETADGFSIRGSSWLRGGQVDPHGDHRLAMALAVAGLASQKAVTVQGAEIITESFPGFERTLAELGGRLQVED